jgi:hypothetical protein
MPEDIYAVLKDQRDALNKLTEEFPRFADRVYAASSYSELTERMKSVVMCHEQPEKATEPANEEFA